MDGLEAMQVRDLHGEDLARLAHASPAGRIRFLVEASEVLAASGDGDVLAIVDGDQVCAAAAAGYHERLGDTRVVTARDPTDQKALRRLLVDVEARSVRHRCLTVISTVDVLDETTRRTFELLGYLVTGAGVVVWTERTSSCEPECSVDTWTVRKEAAVPAQRRHEAEAGGRPAPRSTDEDDEARGA